MRFELKELYPDTTQVSWLNQLSFYSLVLYITLPHGILSGEIKKKILTEAKGTYSRLSFFL